MLPGDMIRWIYKGNNNVVHERENVWSTVMGAWASIGYPSLLIHVDDDTYSWLNQKGFFCARWDDTPFPAAPDSQKERGKVVPYVM